VKIFEPHTQIIRKGKKAKPAERGMVALVEEAGLSSVELPKPN